MLPERKSLPHGIPSWLKNGSVYFITICTQPRGLNQLAKPCVFNELRSSLEFYQERGDIWVDLLLLMPDHLHAIISFSLQKEMKKTITDWKRYTSRHCGIIWQRDFFDHRLRNNKSIYNKAHYIRMNPVRAGLIDNHQNWPYIWQNPY